MTQFLHKNSLYLKNKKFKTNKIKFLTLNFLLYINIIVFLVKK